MGGWIVFNEGRFQELLQGYKENFSSLWAEESYKWEAVAWFQNRGY